MSDYDEWHRRELARLRRRLAARLFGWALLLAALAVVGYVAATH